MIKLYRVFVSTTGGHLETVSAKDRIDAIAKARIIRPGNHEPLTAVLVKVIKAPAQNNLMAFDNPLP